MAISCCWQYLVVGHCMGVKIAFTIKNEIEAESLSTWVLCVLRCIPGPNLVILAWTSYLTDKPKWDKIWQINKDFHRTKMHFGPNLVPSLNGRQVIVWTSSKWGKIWLSSWIWPWKSRSITPKNNRDLNQSVFQIWWFQFGRVTSYHTDKLVTDTQTDWHTRAHTHTQTQATTILECQNWPRVIKCKKH